MATAELTTSASTFQIVGTEDAKAFPKFLRKVISDDAKLSWNEQWRAHASKSNHEWRLMFSRMIAGEIGEPDRYVDVLTDIVVRIAGKTGYVNAAGLGRELLVTVPEPTRMNLSSTYCATLAMMLLAGFDRIEIECSCGSENSAAHNLAFYEVSVSKDGRHSVQIGGHTVAKDGRSLAVGAVDIR